MRSSEIENQIDRQPFFVLSCGLFACVCPHLHNVTIHTLSFLKIYIYIFVLFPTLFYYSEPPGWNEAMTNIQFLSDTVSCDALFQFMFHSPEKYDRVSHWGNSLGGCAAFSGQKSQLIWCNISLVSQVFLCAHSAKSDHCRASGVGQVEGCVSAVPNGL